MNIGGVCDVKPLVGFSFTIDHDGAACGGCMAPAGDFPLTIVALSDGQGWKDNKWQPHPDQESAWAACSLNYAELVSRAVVPVSLAEAEAHYAAREGRRPRGLPAVLAREMALLPIELEWIETAAGNQITRGGFDAPWPWAFLLSRSENGWSIYHPQSDAGTPPPDRIYPDILSARRAVAEHFERRLSPLFSRALAREQLEDIFGKSVDIDMPC